MEDLPIFSKDKAERESQFMALYQKAFPATARYVALMGGTLEEARDVFQDALLAYYEKSLHAPLELHRGETAYLLGMAKFMWLKKYRDGKRFDAYDTPPADEDEPALSHKKIMRFLETAGQKCMDMLRAVYYEKLSMQQVAERFGYSGERSATVQKHKCLEKVRDTVKEKALVYEDFRE